MAIGKTMTLCASGEHYVASYLSALGLVVALTRAGSPTTDLIVTRDTGGRSVSIQVKTGRLSNHIAYKKKPENNYRVWRTGKAAIGRIDKCHWYAFLAIGDWPRNPTAPDLFLIPSKQVSDTLRRNGRSQRDWFWILDVEAEKFRGIRGCEKVMKVISG